MSEPHDTSSDAWELHTPELLDDIKADIKVRLFGKRDEPHRLGRFVLLETLGMGGMGKVHAAYDEQLDRKVAIKVLRRELASRREDANDRLLREAQSLARLSHPNVVQVHEVGVLDDKVFLVMEFVRGVTLTRWCVDDDGVRRAWPEIVALFVAVGRGLAAAHEAGLLHRDIKPENVMVGDDGRARILDFGLARIIDDGRPVSTTELEDGAALRRSLTSTGTILGTPAYMSPEQIAGRPVNQRSDVFSFCVTLYWALYGQRPFVGENLGALERAIEAGEIQTPPRTTEVPAWLHRVVVRGLACRPSERYADMNELVAALERDPDRVRRERRQLGLGVVVLLGTLGLGLGLGARAWGPEEAGDPCAAADVEIDAVWNDDVRDQVRLAFARVELPYADTTARQVVEDLDRYVEAWRAERRASCRATHVDHRQGEEILELRNLCLEQPLRRVRALVDSFAKADADVVERAVAATAALPSLLRCERGEALFLGPRPPTDAATRERVDSVREQLAVARTHELAGRYDAGVDEADAALELARATNYGPAIAEASFVAGDLRLARNADGDAELGRARLSEAVDLAEAIRHDALALDVWNALASRRPGAQSPELTRIYAQRTVAAAERLDDAGASRAAAERNLGTAAFHAGDYEAAERHQRRAIEMARDAGVDDLQLAEHLGALANTLTIRARNEEARAAYVEALELVRQRLGPSHPRTAALASSYAAFLFQQLGAHDEARVLLDEALAIWTACSGPDGLDVARAHAALANLESQAGRLDAAAEHAERALAIHERVYAADDPALAYPLDTLAGVYASQGRNAEALVLLERANVLHRRTSGERQRLPLGLSETNLGTVLVDLGRSEEALAHFDAAEPLLAAVAGDYPAFAAFPQVGEGRALLDLDRPGEALEALEPAIETLRVQDGYARMLADALWAAARARRRRDGRPAGDAAAREALDIYISQGEAGAGSVTAVRAWLGSPNNLDSPNDKDSKP